MRSMNVTGEKDGGEVRKRRGRAMSGGNPGTAPLSIPIPIPTPIICRQCWRSSAAVAVRYSSSLALSHVSASIGIGVGIGIGIDHACRTENRGQAKLKGKNRVRARSRARARKDTDIGETGDRRTLERGKNRSPPLRLGDKGRIQGLFQIVPPLMINVYFQHVIALDDRNQGSASAIGSCFT